MRKTAPPRGYPRPQLQRDSFISLDGRWQFAIDATGDLQRPADVRFTDEIVVPFAPETPASGVEAGGLFRACWYRRQFPAPRLSPGEHLILHLGAVDYTATVWVNGQLAATHEGGYTPFSADITRLLTDEPQQTIIVRAEDDPLDLAKPRGKQDWQEKPHSIWYARTTGIWQSVWLEKVPAVWIDKVRWTANVERWEIELDARLAGRAVDGARLRVRLSSQGGRAVPALNQRRDAAATLGSERVLSDDTFTIEAGHLRRTIALADPGIDDARHRLLWQPDHPVLIDAKLELLDAGGSAVDAVSSYTAMRSIGTLGNRFMLNGRPITLRLVLDQGYWLESGLTAPDDDAYRKDVELVKAMGFNGVRKHQKIEDPRFLYWADRLGLLVWEEMPSAYTFSELTVSRVMEQWLAAVERDVSHPCIIAWVPLNESWGVPDLPLVEAQRHFVQALYHATKAMDPTRPVIGNDGWENVATDIITIHDYQGDPQRLAVRYDVADDDLRHVLRCERPAGRLLILDELDDRPRPAMLTEFGGIALSKERGAWGYTRARTPAELATRYGCLLAHVRHLPALSGFCYTQFTDTYQEANGLLYMDRRPKFPLEHIAIATRGPRTPAEERIEARWRQENRPTRK